MNIQGLEISSETIEDIFEDERILKLVEAQSDIPRGDFERAQGYFPTYVSRNIRKRRGNQPRFL